MPCRSVLALCCLLQYAFRHCRLLPHGQPTYLFFFFLKILRATTITSPPRTPTAMASASISPIRHPRLTPRDRFLTAHIHIATLTFIAALLLTLMLLWHVGTVALVQDYEMPGWWARGFVREMKRGWRTAVWVGVLGMVPLDCVVAVVVLDGWWCVREGIETDPSPATTVPSTPSTYRSLLHHRLSPRTIHILLGVLDILMLAVLTSHIASYILSLPQYLSHCRGFAVDTAPPLEFGAAKVPLSVRDNCVKLNVDIHVAGGFSTFMAIALGLLHGAALLVRGWERVQLGEQGVLGKACVHHGPSVISISQCSRDTASARPGLEDPETKANSARSTFSQPRDEASNTHSAAASLASPREHTSVGAEERGSGVGSTVRRRERCTEVSETAKEGKWDEVLLGCLIDG
ncbi:uncharacterized protein M421DRAFT_339437 [Didymella exigua CBS 183.55]|uniref:Uncharacterized protein n=1 Tax=Didymella exigua CBS 183.55 TaxID=1150837 RepID=A0A6A5RRM8_9PLEO|nr:uncharacterized protein M421DRAFT_339437 [Didymella exigua CBS 183.55]KAF1931091.1 hypothetical protein M421DRAFT_339437 [Didymella exigua CBS 183.55]